MYPSNAVLRWAVPIDGEWHEISYGGGIVHVATRHHDVVEFWTLAHPGDLVTTHQLGVFGTGHRIPVANYRHWGAVLPGDGALVWHLIEDLSRAGGVHDGTE